MSVMCLKLSADVVTNKSATSDASDLPPAEKMKVTVSPFDWFQSPTQDGASASTTPASVEVEPLKDRVLKEIRKYETELLPSPGVTGFDPLHWWGQHEQHCCLIVHARLVVIPVSSAECERHLGLSGFNARHIITSQRIA